jgi:O-antigen/teichoic acid export membrane protein
MMKPVYVLTAPLTGVMVAGLSQTRGDAATHGAAAARFFRLVGVGLFPCAAGLLVVGPDAMTVLGGRNWTAAGPILQALAPVLFVQGFINLATHVFAAAGRSGRLLAASVLQCLLLAAGSLTGFFLGRTLLVAVMGDAALGGALGMAAAYSVVLVAVWFLPYLWWSLRTAAIEPVAVLAPLWPALRSALLMGLVVWALRLIPGEASLRPELRLAVAIVVGVATYALLARRELAWCYRELIAPGNSRVRRPARK